MALIKAEGMFGGERLRACSDEAQLHWPRFLVLSNSFARFEVDFDKIVGVAYAGFKVKPTPDQLRGVLKEYSDNFLLFIYTAADGSLWAEWVTEKENTLRYHTKADHQSPSPDPDALEAFRRAYVDFKRVKSSKLFEISSCLKPLKHFANVSKVFPRVGVGKEVGNGVREGLALDTDLLDGETGDTPP